MTVIMIEKVWWLIIVNLFADEVFNMVLLMVSCRISNQTNFVSSMLPSYCLVIVWRGIVLDNLIQIVFTKVGI